MTKAPRKKAKCSPALSPRRRLTLLRNFGSPLVSGMAVPSPYRPGAAAFETVARTWACVESDSSAAANRKPNLRARGQLKIVQRLSYLFCLNSVHEAGLLYRCMQASCDLNYACKSDASQPYAALYHRWVIDSDARTTQGLRDDDAQATNATA